MGLKVDIEVHSLFDGMTGEPRTTESVWIADEKGRFCIFTDRAKGYAPVMVAAAEMLEALESVLEMCNKGPVKKVVDKENGYETFYIDADDVKGMIEDAIKKARGA